MLKWWRGGGRVEGRIDSLDSLDSVDSVDFRRLPSTSSTPSTGPREPRAGFGRVRTGLLARHSRPAATEGPVGGGKLVFGACRGARSRARWESAEQTVGLPALFSGLQENGVDPGLFPTFPPPRGKPVGAGAPLSALRPPPSAPRSSLRRSALVRRPVRRSFSEGGRLGEGGRRARGRGRRGFCRDAGRPTPCGADQCLLITRARRRTPSDPRAGPGRSRR